MPRFDLPSLRPGAAAVSSRAALSAKPCFQLRGRLTRVTTSARKTLCCLLAPERYRDRSGGREQFVPIEQVHFGARDLLFGGGFYRPEHAGYNCGDDVARLAAYLHALDPQQWTVAQLAGLDGVTDEEDRADELAFVREWFPALRDLYERARAGGFVVVCEIL